MERTRITEHDITRVWLAAWPLIREGMPMHEAVEEAARAYFYGFCREAARGGIPLAEIDGRMVLDAGRWFMEAPEGDD